MSYSERDLKSKLDDMEAEIKKEAVVDPEDTSKPVFPQVEMDFTSQAQGWIDSGKSWFATLPKVGKAAVAIGGVWLGFSVVGAVLHVVSSVVSIGLVGLLVYIGYRLFSNNSSSN